MKFKNSFIALIFPIFVYTQQSITKDNQMDLGAFSISLSVKDLGVSQRFYETLGFTILGGSLQDQYLIMKNGDAVIGLFHGMFQGNILTFNPGWNQSAENKDPFTDVREIQKKLVEKKIPLDAVADEKTSGPAFLMLKDPDGNVIYIDQHR